MKTILAFTFGTIVALIGATYLAPQQTIYETEVVTRTVIQEKVTTIDIDQLQAEYRELAEQLRVECLLVIERHTGDPLEGIRHHVDRHYNGDACAAADEAIHGGW
jgi:hypothetical protein